MFIINCYLCPRYICYLSPYSIQWERVGVRVRVEVGQESRLLVEVVVPDEGGVTFL
jgi:hypothetical protein